MNDFINYLFNQAHVFVVHWRHNFTVTVLTIPVVLVALVLVVYLDADGFAEYRKRRDAFILAKLNELKSTGLAYELPAWAKALAREEQLAANRAEPVNKEDERSTETWDPNEIARIVTGCAELDPHLLVDNALAELEAEWRSRQENERRIAWLHQQKRHGRWWWFNYTRRSRSSKFTLLLNPLKSLLDAVGRGTAAGLLLGLPLDETFEGGKRSAIAIGLGGLIGAMAYGATVTSQVANAAPNDSRFHKHPRAIYWTVVLALAVYFFVARINIVLIVGCGLFLLFCVGAMLRDWRHDRRMLANSKKVRDELTAHAAASAERELLSEVPRNQGLDESFDESLSSSAKDPISRSAAP